MIGYVVCFLKPSTGYWAMFDSSFNPDATARSVHWLTANGHIAIVLWFKFEAEPHDIWGVTPIGVISRNELPYREVTPW